MLIYQLHFFYNFFIVIKNVRYLPVTENGEVIGIISINDVVKETILAQQETINNLQSYLYSNS